MTGPTGINPTWIKWRSRPLLSGFTVLLTVVALTVTAPPARAFFIGIGVPCCGWGPGPYWGYPPPPYGYYPPPAYYPPPGSYPPPAASAPSAYTPAQPTPGYPPAGGSAAPATPRIIYTSKPAFTNSAGQTCREYRTTDSGHDIFGTACKEADGQWRVVN